MESVFQNIDYKNKAIPVPMPDKINDIDTKGTLYSDIIDAATNSTIDLSSINSFTSVSLARDNIYNMIDVMCDDPIISTALNIYAADACEPNDQGRIVWVESDDNKVLCECTRLLDAMNVDKYAFAWVHSLVKYGDLYLKLYRRSEVGLDPLFSRLDESININVFKNGDKYTEYVEAMKNPAELFDLQKFGKNVGYIKTSINESITDPTQSFLYRYSFNQGDIDIYPSTSFVHACIEDNSSRVSEEVCINSIAGKNETYTYKVKRGQSLLYNTFRIWRELSLLENSVILNRITRSALTRIVSVEVGDMEKNETKELLHRIKSMIEQKSSIDLGKTFEGYTNPGPIENVIYIPTHGETGSISVQDLGGEINQGDLVDLDYFRDKLFGSIGIPKQYLGLNQDSGGFSAGESLALVSSNYGKNIKRIQNAFCQAITDAVNLMLLDKGLGEYVNNFTIKMQSPMTKEEKDRKENITTSLSNIREIMGLLENINEPASKLTIIKSLLANTISNDTIAIEIQKEIDKLDITEDEPQEVENEDTLEAQPMAEIEEEPEEEINSEDKVLPNFDELGVSFNEAGDIND